MEFLKHLADLNQSSHLLISLFLPSQKLLMVLTNNLSVLGECGWIVGVGEVWGGAVWMPYLMPQSSTVWASWGFRDSGFGYSVQTDQDRFLKERNEDRYVVVEHSLGFFLSNLRVLSTQNELPNVTLHQQTFQDKWMMIVLPSFRDGSYHGPEWLL